MLKHSPNCTGAFLSGTNQQCLAQQPLVARPVASKTGGYRSSTPGRPARGSFINAAPFHDYNAGDNLDGVSGSRSSFNSASDDAQTPSELPARDVYSSSLPSAASGSTSASASASSSTPDGQAIVPRALTPAAAQQLEQMLLELLPKPPVSTPLAPVLSLMLPLLQPHLSALPPQALLAVLRLCNASGAGHTPSAAWLEDWAAALRKQLPQLTPQTACLLLCELLTLRQTQLPQGLLDDLFVGLLKDPGSCSGSSMAAVLVAVAGAELAHINGSTSMQQQQQGTATSSIGGSTVNVTLASWRSGYYFGRGGSSGRRGPDVTGGSELHPLALHCCIQELGAGDRLAKLQPQELAGVAAAAVALQLKLPAGWLDRFFGALEQQLPRLSGPALALLTASLPQLLPAGGNLRLWRQLGAVVEAQGSRLTAEQLCEVLPLVQAADLPLPVEWLNKTMDKIKAQLPYLGLPQSSRALVSSIALGYSPPEPWINSYMQRFKASLSELNPEGLVDVLRALSSANALPSHQWLTDYEHDLERRFGFIGPVELSTSAFLFANLGHIPSERWRKRFLAEALKFREYYTAADLTQVVWSTVRLSMKPSQQWLEGFVAQLQEQAACLQAYQLAFTFAALQKLGAPMKSAFIDKVLDAYTPALRNASPSDTALLLVTVARLQHVSSYSWLQGVLDHCQDNMLTFDGQELVTILWSLSQLHHQPGPEWMSIFFEAVEAHLSSLTGTQLAQLGYGLGQMGCEPPQHWMEAYLTQCQVAMAADGMGGRDAASLLASLATLQHTPSESWLHACLNLLHWKLRELDPEGLATVAISLVKLSVIISNGPWLDNYVSLTSSRLSGMAPDTQANLLSSLAVWRAQLSPAWLAMFQLLCVKQAEEGSMRAEQLEQVLVALSALGAAPSAALTQLYYDTSLPLLPKTSADSIAAVLRALQDAKLQPDAHWLEAVVAAVHTNIKQYTVLQLNGVAKALTEFESAGLRKPWLQNFVAYLKEFFLY